MTDIFQMKRKYDNLSIEFKMKVINNIPILERFLTLSYEVITWCFSNRKFFDCINDFGWGDRFSGKEHR